MYMYKKNADFKCTVQKKCVFFLYASKKNAGAYKKKQYFFCTRTKKITVDDPDPFVKGGALEIGN